MATSEIHGTMKAAVVEEHKQPFEIKMIKTPVPGRGEALIKLMASGLCHTDVHACDGDWPAPTKLPLTPGHEGAGVVVAVGEGVHNVKVGDRVGYPWLGSACGVCEFCLTGRETLCPEQANTGYSIDGGFAEYCACRASHLAKIPDGLSFEQAAPILCAGVTTYAGLKNTGVRPGQFVTIIGAGGGLGHLAVQYAAAMSMRVVAVDMPDKLDFCRSLGAELAFDATSKDMVDEVVKATAGGSHGVLVVAASLGAFKASESLCRRGGTIVLIGLPKGDLPVNIFNMVLKGITMRGSIVGTRADLAEAMDFAARGKVRCEVEMHSFDDLNEVFDKLRRGQLKGRAVLGFGGQDGGSM